MPFFLKHHFNPDFDHLRLRPKAMNDGRVDHFNLGYVQNVVAGQVVAEFQEVTREEAKNLDKRFLMERPAFPRGANTKLNPKNPRQLLSTVNGYVFYLDGEICIHTLLNVRRDVDFHTGNILFVGDIIVHGGVRSGFELKANNIRVKGTIEAARLEAQGAIVAESGLKGADGAVLVAGQGIRLPFAEKGLLQSRGAVRIDGSCLHCRVYAAKGLLAHGRLQGGVIVCTRTLAVVEQLGGGGPIRIVLGYDPYLVKQIEETRKSIEDLDRHIHGLEAEPPQAREDPGQTLSSTRAHREVLERQLGRWEENLEANADPEGCQVVVPGLVKPGVEINMGDQSLIVQEERRNVRFVRRDGGIHMETPAMDRG